MRNVTRFGSLLVLAILQTGCGSNQQAPSPDIAPRSPKQAAKSNEREHSKEAAHKEASAKSPKMEAPTVDAPKPFIDEAHTGTAKRKKPDADLPSGILTAGSFDDNINPRFFRSFVGKAGQNSYLNGVTTRLHGRRLEIFVKNGEGAPVGNARVSVASGSGEKVDLITRSDGRAIFLSSFDGFKQDAELTVTASSGNGNNTSQKIDESAENCTLTLPAASGNKPRNLDLVILLDTTSSMTDELDFLKAEIKNIATTVNARFPNVSQRYALVCYRDMDVGDEYVTRKFDFTPNIEEFRKNLSAQSAHGGGDLPEAMQKGLEDATKLNWRDEETARVVFLIADAPPHAADAAEALRHINTLRKRGASIYPVFASCNDSAAVEATEVIMRGAALVTGAQYLFLSNDSGVGDAHGEPHIPYYHIEKLNNLMVRMIAGELSGQRLDADAKSIIRTVGVPPK